MPELASVDSGLQAFFGDRWAMFEGDHAHDVQPSANLQHFLAVHPTLLAVSSHLARPPLPYVDAVPIVFLRHPILRLRSVYEFVRRNPSQFMNKHAAGRSFAEYLEWAFGVGREAGGIVVRNYQVVHLSAASFYPTGILFANATAIDFETAKSLLEEWEFVGLVEDFERSCKRYQDIVGRTVPGFTFPVFWQNKTVASSLEVGIQLDAIRDELGPELYHRTVMENALDLQLYSFAKSLW